MCVHLVPPNCFDTDGHNHFYVDEHGRGLEELTLRRHDGRAPVALEELLHWAARLRRGIGLLLLEEERVGVADNMGPTITVGPDDDQQLTVLKRPSIPTHSIPRTEQEIGMTMSLNPNTKWVQPNPKT
jgi:hypothetical protein